MTVYDLPAVNATLNSIATLFLLAGWIAIKRGHHVKAHRASMVAALVSSAVFLACYLVYHYYTGARTPFPGDGIAKIVYYIILATHVPLAALMVPFILAAVWFAFRGQFDRHVRIVKYLWPVWMYVSVTGVLIYLMLYQMY
jgi:uncharacterized membrane protein YozB (DUF420 family)